MAANSGIAARAFVESTRKQAGDAKTPAAERAIMAEILTSHSALASQLGDVMALVSAITMAATKHIAKLEHRIAELEARPAGLKYSGTYDEGRQYMPGEIVTDHGSAWHCREATTQRPGQSKAWQLMVKKGRDGR